MGSIQCHVLVGRDTELGALTASLDQIDQRGGLTFLTGEPGVGKSRIARELIAAATSRGLAVARGRAVEASSPVPLRPLVEALAGVARTTAMPDEPAMAGYLPALATLVPQWRAPEVSPVEISPLILGQALLRLLAGLGGNGTLLVLEDLQFADPETLAVLEYLADNLDD